LPGGGLELVDVGAGVVGAGELEVAVGVGDESTGIPCRMSRYLP
jgi:hypothetical protein